MSDPDLLHRLHRLESIVAQAKVPPLERAGGNVDQVHLHVIRTDRMRLLAAELHARVGKDVDALDGLALRLLLDDYLTSVAHLREVTRTARRRADGAQAVVRESRHFLRGDPIKK